jgi:hypothetical protein
MSIRRARSGQATPPRLIHYVINEVRVARDGMQKCDPKVRTRDYPLNRLELRQNRGAKRCSQRPKCRERLHSAAVEPAPEQASSVRNHPHAKLHIS